MEKPIIEVDATKAEKTIKELRAELKAARADFESAAIGSEDFTKATQQVVSVQNELKSALNASTLSLEQATAEVDVSGKSYAELSITMAELKKVWRETTDETTRASIAANIDAVNSKLKEMDAEIGNYQRNVGNYASAFDSPAFANFSKQMTEIGSKITANSVAFKGWGEAAKNGLKGIAGGFSALGKALIANPIGALITILALLIPLFQKLFDKISLGREVMQKLNVVTSLLDVPMNLLATAIEKLVSVIVDAVSWLVKFADTLGLIPQEAKDAMEASQALADAENELREAEQELSVVQAEQAENKARSADESLTLEERTKALNEAHNAERKALEAKAKAAADMLKAMEKQAALSPTSIEDENKLAQARIAAANAQKAVNDNQREYNQKIAEFTRKKLDEEKKAIEARNKAHVQYLAQLAQNKKDYSELIDLQLGNEKKYTAEYVRLSQERIELDRKEALEKANSIKVEEVRAATIVEVNEKYNNAQKALLQAQKAYQDELIKANQEFEKQISDMERADLAAAWDEATARIKEQAKADDFNLWDVWSDPDKALAAIDANAQTIETLKQQLNDFNAFKYATDEEANAAKMQLGQQLADAQIKASNDEAKADAANSAKRLKAAKTTFGGMVKALESWSDASEGAKAAYKATATAETVMNTAEGAMGAYKAMAGIPYVGPALGIAAAAAVVAEGAAQIKNINAADSGSVSSGGSSSSVSSTTADSGQTTTLSSIESAFIESRSEQQEQKVTIVASDIATAYDSYKAVEVANQ